MRRRQVAPILRSEVLVGGYMTSKFARRPALLAGASLLVLSVAVGSQPVGAASFTVPTVVMVSSFWSISA